MKGGPWSATTARCRAIWIRSRCSRPCMKSSAASRTSSAAPTAVPDTSSIWVMAFCRTPPSRTSRRRSRWFTNFRSADVPGPQRPIAILLMAMGGPDRLENVEAYLKDVRGGRPMTPEFVEDIRERYRATGGKSPVLDIMREIARKLEQRLNGPGGERFRVGIGLRHWKPYIKDAYADLADELPERLVAVCMAPQYSALSIGAYVKKLEEARAAVGGDFPITTVPSWHRHPGLIAAISEHIQQALQKFPAEVRGKVPILFTAHSLPERILQANDPYPDEVQGTMAAVCERLG